MPHKTQDPRPAATFDEWSDGPNHLTKGRRRRRIALLILGAFALWFVPFVPKLSFGTISVTRWTKKDGKVTAKVGPSDPEWANYEDISKHVVHALVIAEDALFFDHHGFDLQQIRSSIETNMKSKRYKRGASTITQQVVKMAFLSREKTLTRKAREAVGAVFLETFYSKNRILEWYVNLIEFGDAVYGVKSAARHYFQCKPSQLTIIQSIHLALVVPSPNHWSKGLKVRALTPFGHARFYHIAAGMRRAGYITEEQWKTALATGDFGRPINGYDALTAAEDPQEGYDEDDVPDEDLHPVKSKPTAVWVQPTVTPLPLPTALPAVILPTIVPSPTLE